MQMRSREVGDPRNVVELRAVETVIWRVRKTAKCDNWLRHVCPSAWNSTPTGQFVMKFDISFFENLPRKLKFY